MRKKITADMIDWDLYRTSVEGTIANESIWALGGSVFAEENIEDLEDELDLIANGDYDELLDKYSDDVWEEYLK